MNTKPVFGGILLIGAMLVAILWYKQQKDTFQDSVEQSQENRQDIESPTPSINDALDNRARRGTRRPAQQVTDSGGGVDTLLLTARHLHGAESAVVAEQALDDLAMVEPDLAEGRRDELAHLCNPAVIESRAASNAHIKTLLEQFCAGFDWQTFRDSIVDADSREEDMDGSTEALPRNPMMRFERAIEAKITSSIQDAPETQKSDAYAELLRNAQVPEEIFELISQNARYANANAGQLLWALGQDIQQARYPEANLLRAQEVALTLYACRRFGGCGSNQYFGMTYCIGLLAGRCRAGSTVEDMLYQVTPPADFGLGMEILAQL